PPNPVHLPSPPTNGPHSRQLSLGCQGIWGPTWVCSHIHREREREREREPQGRPPQLTTSFCSTHVQPLRDAKTGTHARQGSRKETFPPHTCNRIKSLTSK